MYNLYIWHDFGLAQNMYCQIQCVAGHFSQNVWKNFFEGFFEEYDEEYDEEYALDFRPQRAQEACNGDAAFCAFWLLEASNSQSSFQRSQQMTELLSS